LNLVGAYTSLEKKKKAQGASHRCDFTGGVGFRLSMRQVRTAGSAISKAQGDAKLKFFATKYMLRITFLRFEALCVCLCDGVSPQQYFFKPLGRASRYSTLYYLAKNGETKLMLKE